MSRTDYSGRLYEPGTRRIRIDPQFKGTLRFPFNLQKLELRRLRRLRAEINGREKSPVSTVASVGETGDAD
jgi:hypothetical protein